MKKSVLRVFEKVRITRIRLIFFLMLSMLKQFHLATALLSPKNYVSVQRWVNCKPLYLVVKTVCKSFYDSDYNRVAHFHLNCMHFMVHWMKKSTKFFPKVKDCFAQYFLEIGTTKAICFHEMALNRITTLVPTNR